MEYQVPKYSKRKVMGSWQVMEDAVHLLADGLTEGQALSKIRKLNAQALAKNTAMGIRG